MNLARALAAELPDLIMCDEVTSALDTVVGAAIIELMRDLQAKLGVSCVFITHDIAKVLAISDDIVVLYAGRRVEIGSRHALCAPPYHPYSHLLVSSAPELARRRRRALPSAVGADRCAGAVPSQRGRPRALPGRAGGGRRAGAAGASVARRAAVRIVCCGGRAKRWIVRAPCANTRQLRFLTVIK